MSKIASVIGKEHYRVAIHSPTGNELIADEPKENGGQDKGFSPKELLAASLAACTSATVRIYADRKGWNLDEIKTEIELHRDEAANKTIISRKIAFEGNISDVQRTRLIAVANACPLHKILSNPVEINTLSF